MTFNINTFRNSIAANGGVLRNNKFEVRFSNPKGLELVNGSRKTSELLTFWADSANIPGVSFNAIENYRYGYGHREKKVMNAVFNDMQVSFISDANGEVWNFFKNWTNLIYGFDLKKPIDNVGGGSNYGALLHYKDEYAVNMSIVVYSEQNTEVMTIVLRDAFPMLLGEVQLNWRDTNNYARFSTTFTYTDWWVEYPTR